MNTQSETILELEEVTVAEKQIIIYNDDFNTFQFVIETLIKVCKHDVLQAEQCTLLIHYKGKCSVKQGDYDTLKPMCDSITERGIGATIEIVVSN